ncbi:TetR/AcrR family transcriptional regulator [Streptomyces sp. NBC_00286]|uniref:TetR/AcrR family transcriptional regulator n=1 Tax=Streptomyces sp. NBC_00286 TaxID=2975701 RepID=UPI002E28946B|nr:TetR/AcrR family transcriptional regulator [Streptomyces sp. NBC_00286]
MSLHAPPGVGTVYRAVLATLAEHGPRRPPIAEIARRAATSRQYLYRNWPDSRLLIQKACESELDRLLDVAGCTGGTLPQPCRLPAQIVHAARLLREHPVTQATARTSPDLLLTALTEPTTTLHTRALHWLQAGLYLWRPGPDDAALARTLFTVTAPFALVPPPSDNLSDRQLLDTRLTTALHTCLSLDPAAMPNSRRC